AALAVYVRVEGQKRDRILELVKVWDVPVLVGYPDATLSLSGGVITHNAAGLMLPSKAIAGQYEKIHLVPFGERIPFQGILPFLGKLDLGQAEWTPGTNPVVFPFRDAPFGVLICFYSIFPVLARDYSVYGVRLSVKIPHAGMVAQTDAPL